MIKCKTIPLLIAIAAASAPATSLLAQESATSDDGAIVSERILLPDGELILKQTLVLDVGLEQAWSYFTQAEQISSWMAPVAQADIRQGGSIQTHYESCATIGDPGTIELEIVNFIPQTMITLQSSLESAREAAWMNDAIYERRDQLYNVIQFESVTQSSTRITSWGLGYRQGPEWETMLGFFIAGNEWTFGQLQKAVRGETVWPSCEQ